MTSRAEWESESEVNMAVARHNLRKAVLRRLSSEMDEPHAHYADELDYCDDLIDEAATELVRAAGFDLIFMGG